jgi:hypothetical protein
LESYAPWANTRHPEILDAHSKSEERATAMIGDSHKLDAPFTRAEKWKDQLQVIASALHDFGHHKLAAEVRSISSDIDMCIVPVDHEK